MIHVYSCTHAYTVGNLPVAMNNIQLDEIVHHPVYDGVTIESSQVLISNQVNKGPDPVYHRLSPYSGVKESDEVNMKSSVFLTANQVKQGPDPAYQDISLYNKRVTQDPVSDEENMKSNVFCQVLTTDQVKKEPDPACKDLIITLV